MVKMAGETEFELKNAFEHIDRLAYQIGPRLAGTRGEQMAAEYIADKFREYGMETELQVFKFRKRSSMAKASGAIYLVALFATLLFPPLESLVIWALALAAGWLARWLIPVAESRNIVARKTVKDPKGKIALTAHYDTAPCLRARRLHIYRRFAIRPVLGLLTLLLILRPILQIQPWWAIWGMAAALLLPACISPFVTLSGEVSPGADDNASGVAVMLECARVLASDPHLDRELICVAFGAEEQGLAGSRDVAEGGLLRNALVLNLDTLGHENRLAVVEGNGIFRRTRTDRGMNTALEGLMRGEGLEPAYIWAAISSHDHLPLVRRGIRATTLSSASPLRGALDRFVGKLIGRPNAAVWIHAHIHTTGDLPDMISPDNIEHAGRIVINFVRSFR